MHRVLTSSGQSSVTFSSILVFLKMSGTILKDFLGRCCISLLKSWATSGKRRCQAPRRTRNGPSENSKKSWAKSWNIALVLSASYSTVLTNIKMTTGIWSISYRRQQSLKSSYALQVVLTQSLIPPSRASNSSKCRIRTSLQSRGWLHTRFRSP